MRLATLFALLALPAAAQGTGTYAVFATQADLDDGGTLSGAVPTCLLAGAFGDAAGAFFWDATSEQFAIYDATADPGSRTTVPVPAFLIDIAAGTDVATCRDATPELGPDGVPTGVVFLVLSNDDEEDFVARVDAATSGFSVLTDRGSSTDSGDGISGLAQIGDVLYLARQQAFGAPEDGIYTLDTATEGQVPTALVTNAGFDLTAIDDNVGSSLAPLGLFAVSSTSGAGGYQNVILYVDPNPAAPEVSVVARPCDGSDGPALFDDCSGGGLEDIVVGVDVFEDFPVDRIVVSNNAFDGAGGEAVGAFRGFANAAAEPVGIVFRETDLVAATGVSGYATPAPAGYLSLTGSGSVEDDPVLYLASSGERGGTPGIYAVSVPVTVGTELAPGDAFALAVAPNPAAGTARLTVTPEAAGPLRLSVVDALGRTVATLFDGDAARGAPIAFWTPGLAPGVYVVRVEGAAGVRAERFTVVR